MKKIVGFGEVLLRLSTRDFLKFSQATNFNADYGGSELNVLTSLANFGEKTSFVTRLPDNDLGHCVVSHMNKYQIGTDDLVFGGDRLGIYFLEKGASIRGSKIVYDRSNSAFAQITKGMIDWDKVFEEASWFHWSGITPGVSSNAAEVCMEAIEKAREKGLMISTDFNYRANLWNYGKSPREIMEKMVSMCDVILAGDYASKQYFDLVPEGAQHKERQHSLCEKLSERFPDVKYIAVTNRGNISAHHNTWSAILFHQGKMYESQSYEITHIVDRIGAGDSFMGALIYGLLHFSEQKAIDFSVAASCLKHTIYGDANLVSREEVEALMQGDSSGMVKR